MGNESLAQPTVDRSEAARAGFDVWTWRPSAPDWDTFAALLKAREITQVSQPPAIPYPFSPDVIGTGGAASSPPSSGPAGTTTVPQPAGP